MNIDIIDVSKSKDELNPGEKGRRIDIWFVYAVSLGMNQVHGGDL